MLRLSLVRHAQAQPAHDNEEDWDRALEARGERDARAMAQRLRERDLKPQCILTSPAVRALRTAAIMARELGVAAGRVRKDERLYLASPKALLQVVQTLGGDAQHLMVFGHNPGMTEFADELSAERSIDNLPTCSVYSLEFAIVGWSDLDWLTGTQVEFDYPGKA